MKRLRSFATLTIALSLAGCVSNNTAYNQLTNDRLQSRSTTENHPPKLIYSEVPVFPPGPRIFGDAGWKLEIQVSCVVDETGAVRDPTILSSTDSFYDSLALESIRKWRFEPAIKDGKPVKTRVVAPFRFSLQDSDRPLPPPVR